MVTTRPDWDTWALGIASAVAARGDCTRRQVGAVILGADHRIVACGYNGGRPGGPSCLAGDCPRGRHYEVTDCGYCHDDFCSGVSSGCYLDAAYGEPHVHRCGCGEPWPCPDAVAPGSSYDNCLASHAEINAVADVDNRARLAGAVLYCTDEPCEYCAKHIRNTTKIEAIIWPTGGIALP